MSLNMRKYVSHLSPVDVVSIVFLLFLIGLNLVFFRRVSSWLEIITIDVAVIAIIFTLAYWAETKRTRLFIGLHRLYAYPFILFVFKEIYIMVRRFIRWIMIGSLFPSIGGSSV